MIYTALCIVHGSLCLYSIRPAAKEGVCPLCGAKDWGSAPHGWIECKACGEFQVLREHAQQASAAAKREKLAE